MGRSFAGEESNPALTVPEPGTYQHPEQLECGRGGNHPHGRFPPLPHNQEEGVLGGP
jgi:hypothetical protein